MDMNYLRQLANHRQELPLEEGKKIKAHNKTLAKGTKIKCPQCGTQYAKKTNNNEYCNSNCSNWFQSRLKVDAKVEA